MKHSELAILKHYIDFEMKTIGKDYENGRFFMINGLELADRFAYFEKRVFDVLEVMEDMEMIGVAAYDEFPGMLAIFVPRGDK